MSDLISRQAAIEAIKGLPTWWADGGGYYGGAQPPMEALLEPNDVISAIDNLPSAPEGFDGDRAAEALNRLPSAQQWIPCSERLPENDFTDVLVCVYDKRKGCENDFYVIQAYTAEKHWFPTLHVDMMDLYVVAWMPLPEPYKGENEWEGEDSKTRERRQSKHGTGE